MRIIAGKFKGLSLNIPKDKVTRPLKDRARESILNVLTHSNKFFFQFNKAHILDLYSGTGSFGLECLSRKANKIYFVEKNKSIINILKKNINKLKAKEKVNIFENDVFQIMKKNIFSIKFDLIFCDPPFKDQNVENLINLIVKGNFLEKDGIIIFHKNKNSTSKIPEFFKIIDERVYGISKITFGKILF